MNQFSFIALLLFSLKAWSYSWLWDEQFKPTLQSANTSHGYNILIAGSLISIVAHQYDSDVEQHNLKNQNLLLDRQASKYFSRIGSGALGVSIALGQLIWDQENGLMHARALSLTALSHVTLAYATRRKRPDARGDFLPFHSSFPSGHASSAFASAGSLTYAYGWKVGIPAYAIATGVSVARISENSHWLSDVTAGITIGVYWAYASYQAKEEKQSKVEWMPIPLDDGMALVFSTQF